MFIKKKTMITEAIKTKMDELLSTYNNIISGIGYGFKITENQFTSELCIIFNVNKKLPIYEIPENEVLPTFVEIEGITYSTDVVEGVVSFEESSKTENLNENLANCNCYGWNSGNPPPPYVGPAPNKDTIRPLKGGISIRSQQKDFTGSLGFFALDRTTNALVGVTSSYCLVRDSSYASCRTFWPLFDNETYDDVYQNGEYPNIIPLLDRKIGEVLRYVPFNIIDFNNYAQTPVNKRNYSLAALTSVNEDDISINESWIPYGLSGLTEPMTFATTAEINGLMSVYSGSEIWSCARTTGPQQDENGLKVTAVNFTTPIGGLRIQTEPVSITFSDLIQFYRKDPSCPFPIYAGDAGGVLIAVFDGVPKIIGIIQGATQFYGVATRIDYISSQLDIVPWTGQTPNYVNLSTKEFITVPALSPKINFLCSGNTYWQVGLTQYDYTCNDLLLPTVNTVYLKAKLY